MGWEFPYVSTYNTDFPFDFGLAMTPEQAQEIPEVKQMIDDPPDWMQEWSGQAGADLEDGLREGPGYIAFAPRERDGLPDLPGDGARSVRRAVPLLPHRSHAPGAAARSRAPGARTSTRT